MLCYCPSFYARIDNKTKNKPISPGIPIHATLFEAPGVPAMSPEKQDKDAMRFDMKP